MDTSYSYSIVEINTKTGRKKTFHQLDFYRFIKIENDTIFCNQILHPQFIRELDPPIQVKKVAGKTGMIKPKYGGSAFHKFDELKMYPQLNKIEFKMSDTLVFETEFRNLYHVQNKPARFLFHQDEFDSVYQGAEFKWHYYYQNIKEYILIETNE